jgi:geranylgeranyl reductase family protein
MGKGNRKNFYDVIIIGSGPAGSSAAYFLTQKGIKTLVLEKEKLPRYKTCGGGVVGRLKKILPFNFDAVIEKYCYRSEVFDHSSNLRFSTERTKPIIMMTMRCDLDYFILSESINSGAALIDQCRIDNIRLNLNEVEVVCDNEKYYSSFVISADGAMGSISKKFCPVNNFTRLPAFEYEAYINETSFQKFENCARFDFDIVPDGYGWVFPKKDHLSIGVVSMKKNYNSINLNILFHEYIIRLGIERIIKSEKHGFIIPINNNVNDIIYKRILLAGDSAGFADPVTAEGISNAVLSGRLAANAVFDGDFNEELVGYLYKKYAVESILNEHSYAKFISYLVYSNPRIRSFLFKYFGQNLSELMTDIFTGENSYSKLLTSPANYLSFINQLINHNKLKVHL